MLCHAGHAESRHHPFLLCRKTDFFPQTTNNNDNNGNNGIICVSPSVQCMLLSIVQLHIRTLMILSNYNDSFGLSGF